MSSHQGLNTDAPARGASLPGEFCPSGSAQCHVPRDLFLTALSGRTPLAIGSMSCSVPGSAVTMRAESLQVSHSGRAFCLTSASGGRALSCLLRFQRASLA